jgi:hypothetical protein
MEAVFQPAQVLLKPAFFEGLFQPMHLLIFGGFCLTGVVVGIVLVVLTSRKSQDNDRLSSLEEENEHLREEIDRLKGGKA